MSDPRPSVPGARLPEGGDRRPLDRAPGERYRSGGTGSGTPGRGGGSGGSGGGSGGSGGSGGGSGGSGGGSRPRRTRALVAGMIAADAGAVLFFLLGLLDLDVGLVVVAAFAGWATALALVWWGRDAIGAPRTRVGIGALLGAWTVVGGIILDWVYALVQGGVLGPLDYVAQRYGLVALLALVVAAGIAAVRAR